MLVTESFIKSVTNILNLSATRLVSNIRHQHRFNRFDLKMFSLIQFFSKTIKRQLYSNVEVGLELENYYADVALPIVANIECKYSNSVQSVCSSQNLFDGQEFYSLGQVENCNEKIVLEIENDVLEETEVSTGIKMSLDYCIGFISGS